MCFTILSDWCKNLPNYLTYLKTYLKSNNTFFFQIQTDENSLFLNKLLLQSLNKNMLTFRKVRVIIEVPHFEQPI